MPLERVTDGLFDYAGMFPPAELDFDHALREAATFPTTLHDPELIANDMVLTPRDLKQMNEEALHEAGFAGRPCRICLVDVPIQEALEAAARIKEFNLWRHNDTPQQRINTLELHFGDEGAKTLQTAIKGVRKVLGNRVQVYLEPKWDDERLSGGLDGLMMILDGINKKSPKIGFKVRCAGQNAVSHKTLARIMAHVNQQSIPLKLTQGLHHPFAGDERYNNEHGFLNCIFGLRLHRDTDMDLEDLEACLADDAPEDFVWDEGIGWRGHRVSMQSVVESSLAVPFTIGSCSIVEPDADLKELQD